MVMNVPKYLVISVVLAAVVARALSVYDTKVKSEAGIEEHRQRMRTIIGKSFPS